MSYTVLARRYRSATFDDVIGQDHVAQTLKKAIDAGRVAHAYLFCGTRGTGKTSMARILAKALNCEKAKGPTTSPCLQCNSCLAIARGDDIDVIEIDAASNTGVDNVRTLIENSQYRPARSRFKIYVIDEVHMLSKSAFNALLKTLEEPPSHVKFILATTEPEKVLPTILSRCQRFDFRNITSRAVADHLQQVCAGENIQADDDALLMVARAGAGSMRDSLSLLERLLSIGEKRLTTAVIEQLLGLPHAQATHDLVQSIGAGEVGKTLELAGQMITQGLSVDSLLNTLVEHFRNLLIIKTCGPDSGLVEVGADALSSMKSQAQAFESTSLILNVTILEELRRTLRTAQAGRALLDATLARLALSEEFTPLEELAAQTGRGGTSTSPSIQKKKPELASPPPSNTAPQPPILQQAAPPAPSPSSTPTQTIPPADSPPLPSLPLVDSADLPAIWARLMTHAAKQSALEGPLKMARLEAILDGVAVIRFSHDGATFANQWKKNGKRESLMAALSSIVGHALGVRFETDDPSPTPATPPPSETSPTRESSKSPPTNSPSQPSSGKPTPEKVRELMREPLIHALVEDLGGEIIKILEDGTTA